MWIMLISKLPTRPSPPKLAIFWSIPWPTDDNFMSQYRALYDDLITPDEEVLEMDYLYDEFGKQPNGQKARQILYKGQTIRVWANEFSVLGKENMRLYVLGDDNADPSHEFVPEGVASEKNLRNILEEDDRFIYDAALLDGCSHQQALQVALGNEVVESETGSDFGFAPIGWYRCVPGYAEIFCHPWEMAEDEAIESELAEV